MIIHNASRRASFQYGKNRTATPVAYKDERTPDPKKKHRLENRRKRRKQKSIEKRKAKKKERLDKIITRSNSSYLQLPSTTDMVVSVYISLFDMERKQIAKNIHSSGNAKLCFKFGNTYAGREMRIDHVDNLFLWDGTTFWNVIPSTDGITISRKYGDKDIFTIKAIAVNISQAPNAADITSNNGTLIAKGDRGKGEIAIRVKSP